MDTDTITITFPEVKVMNCLIKNLNEKVSMPHIKIYMKLF